MSKKIISEVYLKRSIDSSRTRHLLDGEDIGLKIALLRVVQIDDDPGYYLMRCDSSGTELTDTYHESLKEALLQAEWEAYVPINSWVYF
tara:strand:+ start:479 stop:745 length:267 start_codon:yes stop_codon:yes gene_type:complete